jgi:hypothetical protein
MLAMCQYASLLGHINGEMYQCVAEDPTKVQSVGHAANAEQ